MIQSKKGEKTMEVIEGYMPYLGHLTYYRIVGKCEGNKKPIILLHGGPGSTHNYFEVLDALASTNRQVIMYDQIGCGNSYVEGEKELWKPETWDHELMALREYLHLDKVHLLGQSWGGMLIIEYLCNYHTEGIQSVILSSTLSSASLWAKEQHRMIRFMSKEDQEAIYKAEATNNYSDEAYLKANEHYMVRHCSSVDENSPECIKREKRSGSESYLYGWGPNEYTPTGTLKDFEYTEQLKKWKTPALIISGTNDLCTPLVAKTMYDAIPDSKWELFENCRHTCFIEDTSHYLEILTQWLDEHD